MKLQLGVSVKTIVNPATADAIDRLGNSAFLTFESSFTAFHCPEHDDMVRRFTAMLRRTGKRAPTYHLPYGPGRDPSAADETVRRADVAANIALFEEAQSMTANLLVMHGSGEPVPLNGPDRAVRKNALRRSLAELEPELSRRGLRLAVELLPRSCLGHTADELLELLAGTSDTIGICLDVNHLMDRYAALADYVRRFGSKLYSLHISDYSGVDEQHLLPRSPGCVIDWEAFLAALDGIDYRGVFNYELRLPGMTPADRIAAVEANFQKNFSF